MSMAAKYPSLQIKTYMKTIILFILTLTYANISFAESNTTFNVVIPDWTFTLNPNDPFFTHTSEDYQGVLTKKSTDFAPSLLVFKLIKNKLKTKKISFKTWLESELFENKLTYLGEEKTEHIKTFVYKGIGESILYVYVFSSPEHLIIMTQDTNIDMQFDDFKSTKHDLESAKFLGL
jgi:hypothetical protein